VDTGQSDDPPFRRIGIVGLGLIGGSIALAARQAWPTVRLVAAVRREHPQARQVVDEIVTDVAALAPCDLIVVAVPIDRVPECLLELSRSGTRAVVTDVSSTKRQVMAAATAAGLPSFVGGHPMAGGERPGLDCARGDLFRGRPWILVKATGTPAADAQLERFAIGLGAVVRWMDAETHDRTVAYVSHLPQIVAAALMNAADAALGTAGQAVAGNAFGEMTRLASSPPEMWTAVLGENRDYVREALARFIRELPADPAGVEPGDWVREALTQSGEARARWRATSKPRG
jgi:prephenate dehydrogenase